MPKTSSIMYEGKTYSISVSAQCYDTGGNYSVLIGGQNFGDDASSLTVTIGGRLCEYPSFVLPDYSVTCHVPQGLGDNNEIVVTVGSQSSLGSPLNAAPPFAYDPPIVKGISPNTPNALGAPLTFTG
jgi:hypothetical protein